jgi:hypothetical protein
LSFKSSGISSLYIFKQNQLNRRSKSPKHLPLTHHIVMVIVIKYKQNYIVFERPLFKLLTVSIDSISVRIN